jgi:hypothetical protein
MQRYGKSSIQTRTRRLRVLFTPKLGRMKCRRIVAFYRSRISRSHIRSMKSPTDSRCALFAVRCPFGGRAAARRQAEPCAVTTFSTCLKGVGSGREAQARYSLLTRSPHRHARCPNLWRLNCMEKSNARSISANRGGSNGVRVLRYGLRLSGRAGFMVGSPLERRGREYEWTSGFVCVPFHENHYTRHFR